MESFSIMETTFSVVGQRDWPRLRSAAFDGSPSDASGDGSEPLVKEPVNRAF